MDRFGQDLLEETAWAIPGAVLLTFIALIVFSGDAGMLCSALAWVLVPGAFLLELLRRFFFTRRC